MSVLLGTWTTGLILALLALGIFISFRVFMFPDITADGSFTLGACVAAALLAGNHNPWAATGAAFLAGMMAGASTGILHTKFKIHGLLSSILVVTALYSVNLHVLGKSNIALQSETTLATFAEQLGDSVFGGRTLISVLGWDVPPRDVAMFVLIAVVIGVVGSALYVFFRTSLGTAMRAAGDNDQMIRALGVNVGNMMIAGLALSNGLTALSGALFAQMQGFADVQMGIGMVVWGLASVIIGEALVGARQLGLTITGAIMGSVLFKLMVQNALRLGLDANDLKFITATFVFVALILPSFLARLRWKKMAIVN